MGQTTIMFENLSSVQRKLKLSKNDIVIESANSP